MQNHTLWKPLKNPLIERFLYITIFLIIGEFIYASAIPEERFSEIRSLSQTDPEDFDQFSINNQSAAELLEALIEEYRPSISEDEYAQLSLMLAELYHNARDYEKVLEISANLLQSHPEYYGDIVILTTKVRNVRKQYNEILALFLEEIKKNPNSLTDPLNTEQALEYIDQLRPFFSLDNVNIDTVLEENRSRLKLALDRGYRDRILQEAREFLARDNFTSAINRYLTISDIDTVGRYETSFDIQKEEFFQLPIADNFKTQLDTISNNVRILSQEFRDGAEQTVQYIDDFLDFLDTIFPQNPSELPLALSLLINNFEENRANFPEVDIVLSSLSSLIRLERSIIENSVRLKEIVAQITVEYPEVLQSGDGEHLRILQQLLEGGGESEREGILGAIFYRLDSWGTMIKEIMTNKANLYLAGLDSNNQNSENINLYRNAYNGLSEFILIFLSYLIDRGNLDRSQPLELIAELPARDREIAMRVYLTRELLSAQLEFDLQENRYNEILQDNIQFEESLQNSLGAIAGILLDIESYSIEFLDRVSAFRTSVLNEFNNITGNELVEEYLNRYNSLKDPVEERMLVSVIEYFQDYANAINANIGRLQNTISAELEDGIGDIDGIAGTSLVEGVSTSTIRYYPSTGGVKLQRAESASNELANILDNYLNSHDNFPSLIQNFDAVAQQYNYIQGVLQDNLITQELIERNLLRANQSIAQSESLLTAARISRSEFTRAQVQNDFSTASDIFRSIEQSYNSALNIDYRDNIRNERDDVLAILSEDLSALFFDTIRVEKAAAINRVVEAIDREEYFQARDALEDARNWDEQLPTDPDPIIAAYAEEIERIILLSEYRDLPPISDSRYTRISNDLNEAGKSLQLAKIAAANNNPELVQSEIQRSRNFLDSVQEQIPANFEAALIELQLIELENPDGFDSYFEVQVDDIEFIIEGNAGSFAEGEYSEYTIVEKDQLLARIEALNQLRQNSQLEDYIIDIEVELGRRESPELIAQRNRANNLVQQSYSLINQARGESNQTNFENILNQALRNLRQAQAIYPLIPDISSLISEAEVLLGLEVTVSLPFEANQIFEQAAAFYVNQNLVETKRLLDILWSNSNYRSYFPLKSLITEVYNLIGQNIPESL